MGLVKVWDVDIGGNDDRNVVAYWSLDWEQGDRLDCRRVGCGFWGTRHHGSVEVGHQPRKEAWIMS